MRIIRPDNDNRGVLLGILGLAVVAGAATSVQAVFHFPSIRPAIYIGIAVGVVFVSFFNASENLRLALSVIVGLVAGYVSFKVTYRFVQLIDVALIVSVVTGLISARSLWKSKDPDPEAGALATGIASFVGKRKLLMFVMLFGIGLFAAYRVVYFSPAENPPVLKDVMAVAVPGGQVAAPSISQRATPSQAASMPSFPTSASSFPVAAGKAPVTIDRSPPQTPSVVSRADDAIITPDELNQLRTTYKETRKRLQFYDLRGHADQARATRIRGLGDLVLDENDPAISAAYGKVVECKPVYTEDEGTLCLVLVYLGGPPWKELVTGDVSENDRTSYLSLVKQFDDIFAEATRQRDLQMKFADLVRDKPKLNAALRADMETIDATKAWGKPDDPNSP